MFRVLFLLFITIPIIEMGVLIWVGGYVGILPTLALVVMTAVLGVALLRLQGFLTLNRIQEKLAFGEIPDTELIEGGLLLIGGALLLTPGFVTDALGFMFLLPFSRRFFAKNIINSKKVRLLHYMFHLTLEYGIKKKVHLNQCQKDIITI